MKNCCLVVIFFMLSGCTAAEMAKYQPQWQKDWIAKTAPKPPPPQVIVKTDQFSKEIEFIGPSASVDLNDTYGGWCRWSIRSWMDKTTHRVENQLYTEFFYHGEWKTFWAAADDHADDLPVTKIDSSVGDCDRFGCSLSEIIGVELNNKIYQERLQHGYPIKLSARDGESLVITINPEQIKLQAEALAKQYK